MKCASITINTNKKLITENILINQWLINGLKKEA